MALGEVGRVVSAALGLDAVTVDVRGEALPWSSSLPVGRLALDSVGLASAAMNLAAEARGLGATSAVLVDPARVAASFGSERLLRIDGEPPTVWAPLSGFWPTIDGWVRTHANYPHHERVLRHLVGISEGADRDAFAAAIARAEAGELEERAAAAGAVVSAVRTAEQWRQHPQARRIDADPLVGVTRFAGAPQRPWRGGGEPLSQVRVLDLTRVIAGPVAARDLALAGAEVLRIDSPRRPETPWIHLDTGQGKRSALLDLADPHDRAGFERLLSGADVLLTGYRPGALSRFGLDPIELAARHPGLVTASVSAWGAAGPWGARRGFDSIVQAGTGIAMRESADGVAPGALPVQALDHATGHFLAAAITTALLAQRRTGGSIDVRVSLARTARALLDAPTTPGAGATVISPASRERVLADGRRLAYAPPVLAFAGAPDDYRRVGGEWGADAPAWTVGGGV